MISPSNGTPLNVFHCVDGYLDLCATWLILVASSVTDCNRRPSPLVLHLLKTRVVIVCLASVCIWQHLWHLKVNKGTGITKLCPPFWALISGKSMEWCQKCCCSMSAGHSRMWNRYRIWLYSSAASTLQSWRCTFIFFTCMVHWKMPASTSFAEDAL